MSITFELRSNIDAQIKEWKQIQGRLGTSLAELLDRLADEGVDHLRFIVPTLTGKLKQSIHKGRGWRGGILGRRGFFQQQYIIVGADHATHVDEGTKPSPGPYFPWITPLYQKSLIGGRISADYLGRKGVGPRLDREAWGMHPGTPARNFIFKMMNHLDRILYMTADEVFEWFWGR